MSRKLHEFLTLTLASSAAQPSDARPSRNNSSARSLLAPSEAESSGKPARARTSAGISTVTFDIQGSNSPARCLVKVIIDFHRKTRKIKHGNRLVPALRGAEGKQLAYSTKCFMTNIAEPHGWLAIAILLLLPSFVRPHEPDRLSRTRSPAPPNCVRAAISEARRMC